MAPKTKKGLKGSTDDVLYDLLGDEMTLPEKPVILASSARDNTGVAQTLSSARARTKSLLENNTFSTMAELAGDDAEDLDDMDADVLGLKKSHLASSKSGAKGSGKEELPNNSKPADILLANEKGDAIPTKKPSASPRSFGHQYKKFSFEDLEDPLAGLLPDDEEGITKKPPKTESKVASKNSPAPVRDQGPSIPLTPRVTPIRKKEELLFDDEDNLTATLGFEDSPETERKQTGDQEGSSPARSKLDELLGRGTATKRLAHPGTGEHWKFKLDRKYQRPQDKEDSWGNEDFTFGAYQPTMGSSEGRQVCQQSVSRFLAEGDTDLKREPGSKQSTPATISPNHPWRGGADWLGLKEEEEGLLPSSPTREPQKGGSVLSTPTVPHPESQHSAPGLYSAAAGLSSAGAKPPPKGAKASQPSQLGTSDQKEEEDWLSYALSQKKSQGLAKEEHTVTSKDQSSVEAAGRPPSSSQSVTSTQGLEQRAAEGTSAPAAQKPPAWPAALGSPVTWNPATLALTAGDSKEDSALGYLSSTEPAICFASSQEPTGLSVPVQVQKLELEWTQHKLLLESLQQRYQADLELIENAHRSCIKELETLYQQREECLRRENEELSAQHQRRLVAIQQEKVQEMERVRELQRASILDMRKDHEEQLQRLKLLKDQEIDAVTSATSHTRSLNGIIEQMEKFSSSLNELSSRVEASYLTTTQERELGVQQQGNQLRALQESLGRQQQNMEEERSRLQEVIGKMEARLNEQSRLLEQERWRVSAEQSKAESMQRALEEQRKVMAQQMAMEREELERAKSALLEEQKSVMLKCGEERRRLAAEWAEFVAQQKLSKDRAEREAERALQVETYREGTFISLAKEQAELKIRANALCVKEDQLAAEREALERERQELRLEKERVSATAQRSRLRAEEVERMSQVASEKYEEAERLLREALQVQSEQRARLQLMQQQQEQLQQQEQHVHQEHLSLAQQRLHLDRVRQDLPSISMGLLARAQGLAASSPSVPDFLLSLFSHGGSCFHQSSGKPATWQPGPLAPPRRANATEIHS
ncbi:fas-binding factor 1 isoform X4 [Saccopteryx leptura]|uniref:fas-binding factor 1 isoform X4 n=1 Tax=Saccopteryx leptura TaxID=249018 RepID=UPI00339C2F9A